MESMGKAVGSLSSKHENFLIIEDINTQANDTYVKDFCDIYSFKRLIKERTQYKNHINQECIDLIPANRQDSFRNYCVIDTGLSNFHKMGVTVLRSYFLKAEPKTIMDRDYNKFSISKFRSITNTRIQNSSNTSLSSFMHVCKEALDKVEPLQQKYNRANDALFISKNITEAIMKRTRLRHNYLKKIDAMQIGTHIMYKEIYTFR